MSTTRLSAFAIDQLILRARQLDAAKAGLELHRELFSFSTPQHKAISDALFQMDAMAAEVFDQLTLNAAELEPVQEARSE